MSTTQQPLHIRIALWRFKRDLAEYYEDLASFLAAAKEVKMLDVFLQDAQRFGQHPRGVLSAVWAQRYQDHGADLVQAWTGFLPEDDLAVLRAQQEQGPQALISALRDLARGMRIKKSLHDATRASVGVGVLGLAIAAGSAVALPVMAVGVLQNALDVPVEQWGPLGQTLHAMAQTSQEYGLMIAAALAAGLWALGQSITQWTGPGRDWADKHLFLYRVPHQVHAMRLCMTMATLTAKTTTTMQTLRRSIELVASGTATPWQRWQLQRLLDRMDSGVTNAQVFDSGVLSQEMYWRLDDLARGHTLSESFALLVDTIERLWLPRLLKRLTAYRWVMLIATVAFMAYLTYAVQGSIFELREVVMNSMS